MRRCLSLFLMLLILCVPVSFGSASSAPVISGRYPTENAVNVSFNNSVSHTVYLRANITDADGDLAYLLFETNRTGNWTKIAEANITGNWTTSTYIPFSNLTAGAKYWWRVKARDAGGSWTNASAWSFKLKVGGGTTNGTKVVDIITIVPSSPKPGGTVIFLINRSSASGYVICNATMNVYPIIFEQGLGSIELEGDYGPALIYIVDYGTKIFTIKNLYEGMISIDSPNNVDLGKEVKISVLASGKYVSSTLSLKSPSNITTSRQTSSEGPTSITFNEAGIWTLHADVYNSNVTKSIYVKAEPLDITVDGESTVGNEILIKVNNRDAEVEIRKDDATFGPYAVDTGGRVFFTPEFAGRYTITATAVNQRGTKTFDVKSETFITIQNSQRYEVSKITEGDTLFIRVQDDAGNNVDGDIQIYGDDLTLQTIPLDDGYTLWVASPQAKFYRFYYEPDGNLLLPSQSDVKGVPPDMTLIYVAAGLVILAIFIVILLLNRAGYINIEKLKNLSGGIKDDLL